jgi:hypothetical protein
MQKAIYFDMDGTLADFFGVNGWLEDLHNSNSRPYRDAARLYDYNRMENLINKLKKAGYIIGIISWCSMTGTPDFNKEVRKVKREWLKTNFPWADEIHITKYGTPKHQTAKVKNAILVDDSDVNLNSWNLGKVIPAKSMMNELERMV